MHSLPRNRFIPWNTFFYLTNREPQLPFPYKVDPYFVNLTDMCSTKEITKTGIYIQRSIKIIFFLWKGSVISLVFNKEIAFKYFLFINITKFRFLLFFNDHTDIKGNAQFLQNITVGRREKNDNSTPKNVL